MSRADDVTPVDAGGAGDVLDTSDAGPLALRGSVLRVIGTGGGMLLALISAPLVIRHLHQVGYGRYVTALSIAAIAGGLTEGGVTMIALREFASLKGESRDGAMASMLGVRLLLSAVGVIGAVGFAVLVGYPQAIVAGTAVAGVALTLQVLQGVVSVPLQGTMRLGWVSTIDLVRSAVSTLLIVVLVLAGAGVVPLLAASAAGAVVALLLTVVLVRGSIPLRPSIRFSIYAPLLREIFPYAVAIALSATYFRVTVVVMSLEASALQTGYFSTSFRVVEILISLPVLVVGTAYPIITRAARDDPARFAYATRRMFELSVLVGGWLALAVLLGAGFVVDVFGGHAAAPAAAVLRIQGLAVAGTFVAVACGFPLLSLRRYSALLVANGLGFVVTLAASLSLIPWLDARGAAISTVAAELTLAVTSAVALARARRGLQLPLSSVPVAVLAGGIGFGAAKLTGLHPVLEVAIATCIYGLVLALIGRFPPEISHALRPGRAAGRVP
jgi:O-antigen/teichoic acid export membrane protein